MASLAPSDLNRAYAIEKLTGLNYPIWKVKMEMLLIHNNLFGLVDGTEPQPTDPGLMTDWKLQDSKAKSDFNFTLL